ncbi:tRNA N(3)-methylcytidine methyltransferase METTL6 isoform X1 [Scyliorhinus canicula]|uniref:tRNA N(3)-methylcytidine methyltransferase METTL6 isoform X1 n=1 Tax=Scyliorhinus canicula TaxID=7830 RepID=UPI0018F5113E|nr:tRNA N(3)-methylcytidine methyltransferase METTL6 isoform X1 [Scyliorhinus canicula]
MEDDIETNDFFATQTYQREGLNNCSLSSTVATVTPSKSEVPFQVRGDRGRILTPEEAEKLINDQRLVSDFKQQKLEIDAQKNWDLFYKRNSTNFFKDRHWTTREFEELKACREFENQKLILLEAGCGVGNCLFPLLEDDLNVFIYACDFSPRAIEFVKQNRLYKVERCKAFQCDLTKDDLLQNMPVDSVDVVTLIFVLSAIHPDKMQLALENIHKILKPGGYILFRDYGLYDHAMLRFKTGHKLGPNFYVRQDGTRSFFFSDEYVAQLLTAAGFEVLVNEYVFRETVNKKEGGGVDFCWTGSIGDEHPKAQISGREKDQCLGPKAERYSKCS